MYGFYHGRVWNKNRSICLSLAAVTIVNRSSEGIAEYRRQRATCHEYYGNIVKQDHFLLPLKGVIDRSYLAPGYVVI